MKLKFTKIIATLTSAIVAISQPIIMVNAAEQTQEQVVSNELTEEATNTNEVTQENEHKAPKFIIDADFASDVDDAFAVSLAMYFQDMGVMDVVGIALSCTSTRGAYAMSALTASHGYWDIPIAVDWDDGVPMGSDYHLGMTSYPHKEEFTADTVAFYRRLLSQSVEPVNIIVTGQLVNISRLLDSEPDGYSPLTGRELVAEKVECMYLVAGKSNGGLENNIFYCGEDTGYNKWLNGGVTVAAQNVAKTSPVPLVFLEADLVGSFEVGNFLNQIDKNKTDILTKALYDFGKPEGCASFDPMGVYIAVGDANGLLEDFQITKLYGSMRIFGNGTSEFIEGDPTYNHMVIRKNVNDGWYRSMIDGMLKYEFNKRHPLDK